MLPGPPCEQADRSCPSRTAFLRGGTGLSPTWVTVFTEAIQKVVPIRFSSLRRIVGKEIGSEVIRQELAGEQTVGESAAQTLATSAIFTPRAPTIPTQD